MRTTTNAPKNVTWIICLVLFIIALVTHFGVIRVDPLISTWSWIIGFTVLLLACRLRGL